MRTVSVFLGTLLATATVQASNSLRQYKRSALVDVCANIEADLEINGKVFGRLDICLCVSVITSFCKSNPIAKQAVLLFGEAAVTSALNSLMDKGGGKKHCSYPDHCDPFCQPGNPCGFNCKDGFTPYPPKNPTECVCERPNTVCNGKCGNFPHCSSQKAKRSASWRDAACPHGSSACGVWGGSHLDYECVDTRSDLWSCGGCDIPLLEGDPTGVDCTALHGVSDVACVAGRCQVMSCKDGLRPDGGRSKCIPAISPALGSLGSFENLVLQG